MGVAERRERERQERRETILAAATEVFLRHGLGPATMDQIARQAELSKGALYLYFKSKDELYLAVTLSALEKVHARIEQAMERSYPSGMERFAQLLHTMVTMARENGSRFRVVMSWLATSHEIESESSMLDDYRRHVEFLFDAGAEAIACAQVDGSMGDDTEPRRLMSQVWSAMMGAILAEQSATELKRRVGYPLALGGTAESTTKILLRGLRAAPSRERDVASAAR